MPVTININDLSLCHKGSNGVSTATLPDMCKTPTPGGPQPMPYPNVAMSSDLAKGTTTITADGGNMCANYGSEFSKSTGDEPGSLGGVTSGTFIKEATWITFSFDVKLEGKAACRLTDKMFHNHQNTVNMGGLLQAILAVIKIDPTKGCQMLLDYIEQLIGEGQTGKQNGIRGLEERFQDQKIGKMAPTDPIPPGKTMNGWDGHNKQIEQQQKALNEALDEHDDKCKGGNPPPKKAREWATKPLPKASEWTGPVAVQSSGLSWGQIGWGALAVGMTVVTVAAVVCPFDGPFGDAAAGSGAAAAWARALGGAARAGAY